jgi:hypothetical protein
VLFPRLFSLSFSSFFTLKAKTPGGESAELQKLNEKFALSSTSVMCLTRFS